MGSSSSDARALVALMVVLMVTGGLPAPLMSSAGAPAGGDAGGPALLVSSGDHQWPMFARDSSHSGEADALPRGLSNPGIKWNRAGGTPGHGTVIGNFTGNVLATNASHSWDGELRCAVYATANQVHLVEGGAGEDVWLLNQTGTFTAAPALGDVDGDGRTDVLLASRTGGVLYCYEPVIRWNGTRFTWWGNNTDLEQLWNTTVGGAVTSSNLVLDDLNGNGTQELMVGSSQGVYCLNSRYGNELWNRTVSGRSISTPAVFEVGTRRNVVATSYNSTVAPPELHVYTIRGTSGALQKHISMELTVPFGTFLPPTLPFFPSPVTADLDRQDDGDELVIVQPYEGATGRIIVFKDGDLDWNSVAYNKSLGGSAGLDHICHATPAVADLDGDNVMDVVVASWRTYGPTGANTYTNVSVFKGPTGTRGWRTDIDETIGLDLEWAMSSPVLMDADKDGVLDVLVLQYNRRMSALSGKNGTVLWDITIQGGPTALMTTSPAVGDLDGDGFPEVVVYSQAVSFLLPDLEVTSDDVSLTDPTPEEGESVGIDVLVHNEGNEDAEDVLVTVWDGDAWAGNATIATIVAGSSYSARVTHEFYGQVDHVLRVEVDPLDDIEELREDNNNATKDVTIVSKWGVDLDCTGNETFVNPGTTWHYFCEVVNLGQFANRIRVATSSVPAGWTVTVDPANFLLSPSGSSSDSTVVDVEVRVPSTAKAGEYPITVTATSQNQSRNNDSVVLTTVVRGTHGVFVIPMEARSSVAPGDAVVYRFNATNIGNAVDSFQVEVVTPQPDPDWGVNVFPHQIDALAPEDSKEIRVSVSAPYEAVEGETFTAFLHVESVTEPGAYDDSKMVTSVVIPDIAVLGLEYARADGSRVDGDTRRLVEGEEAYVVARITNLRRNTAISNLRVRFTVDGSFEDVTVQDIPSVGITEVTYETYAYLEGAYDVVVAADPFEVISDADRSNNVATGTFKVKDPTPVGSYNVTGTVYLSDNVTPVPGADVRVRVVQSGYSFTVETDGEGQYNATLADINYKDGNRVVLNATDGRDFAEANVTAYSEDGGATVDLVLGEGVHHDVALLVASEVLEVDTGEAVSLNVTLASIGNRAATVDLSVTAQGWGPSLESSNGTPVTSVDLAAGGSVDIVLVFDVPGDAEGGENMTFRLMATPREDPDADAELNVTATVRSVVAFGMQVTSRPPDNAHPGEDRAYNLTVINTGNVDDTIDLASDPNFAAWCVTFDIPQVSLPAFGMVVVRVTFTIPPAVEAGNYSIFVSGVSRADDTKVANVYLEETVEARRYGVAITPTQTGVSGRPGGTVWWQLKVTNLGNVEDSYTMSVFGLSAGYSHRFKVGQAAVTEVRLAPGETETMILELDVPTTFTTTPSKENQLTVKATSVASAGSFNNTQLTFTLNGILDLVLTMRYSTNRPEVGKRMTFFATVQNLGPDDASGVVLFYYLGEDQKKKTVGEVKAGEEKEVEIEWIPTETGPIQVRFVLNPTGEDFTIFETDRGNNDEVKPLRVEEVESDTILSNIWFWLLLAVIAMVIVGAWSVSRGGRGEVVEVVEVAEEEGPDEEEEVAEEEEGPDEEEEEEKPRRSGKKAVSKKRSGKKRRPPKEGDEKGDEMETALLVGRM